MLTLSGVTKVKGINLSARKQAAAIDEMTLAMEDEGVSLTALTVESRMIDCHFGIRPAGVDGRHCVRMMRLLSG